MQLTLTCKDCGKTMTVVDEPSASRRYTCVQCGTTLALPSNVLDTGTVMGGFEIEKHLGCGTMGSVYLARQLSMDRQVAVKVLAGDRCHEEAYKKDFLNEIKMLGKLDHPNIVTALEAGEQDGQVYVAMRYVPGKSLEEKVAADGPFDEDDALRIALKLSEALRFAWQRHGLLHRDIKPANIMLDQHKEPILLDLGLFKVYGDDAGEPGDGQIMGTPFYMSPEQASAPKEIDCRSDIYALGCTLYHALTGRVPFDGDDVYSVLTKHKLAPVPSPRAFNLEVSDLCCELLAQMMAKAPEKRHSSWTDLIAHIQATLDPRPVTQVGLPAQDPSKFKETVAPQDRKQPKPDDSNGKASVAARKEKRPEPVAREIAEPAPVQPPNEALLQAQRLARAAWHRLLASTIAGWNWTRATSLRCWARIAAVEWKKHSQTCWLKISTWSRIAWAWLCNVAKQCREQFEKVDWKGLPAKGKERFDAVEWKELPAQAKANPGRAVGAGGAVVFVSVLFIWFVGWLFRGPPTDRPIVTIGNAHAAAPSPSSIQSNGEPAVATPPPPTGANSEIADPMALPDIGRSEYTLMFWFQTKHDGVLFSQSGDTWRKGAKTIFIRDGLLGFDACGTGAWLGQRSVLDNELHHVAVLGGAPMRLYLDGEVELTITKSLPEDVDASALRLGFCPKWFDCQSFRGIIDEVQLYKSRLNERQMDRIGVELKWQGGDPAPLIYWTFGENRGPAGIYPIMLKGNSSFAEARQGKGLQLDGKGYAEIITE